MKIFSLPVIILIAVGVIAAGTGGFFYATSGYTDYRQHRHHEAAGQPVGQASTDGTPASTDNATAPAAGSPAPADGATASTQPNNANGGGNGGQNNPEREQRRQQRMQQMATELGLTDAQKQQMEQIRATITDRTQRRAAIMAILTPDQQAKMEQMRGQRGGNRGGGGGGAGGNGGGNGGAQGGTAPATPAPATH